MSCDAKASQTDLWLICIEFCAGLTHHNSVYLWVIKRNKHLQTPVCVCRTFNLNKVARISLALSPPASYFIFIAHKDTRGVFFFMEILLFSLKTSRKCIPLLWLIRLHFMLKFVGAIMGFLLRVPNYRCKLFHLNRGYQSVLNAHTVQRRGLISQ